MVGMVLYSITFHYLPKQQLSLNPTLDLNSSDLFVRTVSFWIQMDLS